MTDNAEFADMTLSADAMADQAGAAGGDVICLPDERQRTKKVTSGSENRQRRHVERFRTDDIEHEALHAHLRARSLSLGEYVMQLGNFTGGKAARSRRRGRAAVDDVALTQGIVAFNRAGNNHNQTVRGLNELLVIAREQSNARLEGLVLELAEAIKGIPALFAVPVAAIMAALTPDCDENDLEG